MPVCQANVKARPASMDDLEPFDRQASKERLRYGLTRSWRRWLNPVRYPKHSGNGGRGKEQEQWIGLGKP